MTTSFLATYSSSTRLTLICMSLLRYVCLYTCLFVKIVYSTIIENKLCIYMCKVVYMICNVCVLFYLHGLQHKVTPTSIIFSPNGKLFATMATDGKVSYNWWYFEYWSIFRSESLDSSLANCTECLMNPYK